MGGQEILKKGFRVNKTIKLPENSLFFPHKNAIYWHRHNIFAHATIIKGG